jgi:hypothetical protein
MNQKLFDYLYNELGVTALSSQMGDIEYIVLGKVAKQNAFIAGYNANTKEFTREDMEAYGKLILKQISDTFLNPENIKKASWNDQAVIQAVGETIINFPMPPIQSLKK